MPDDQFPGDIDGPCSPDDDAIGQAADVVKPKKKSRRLGQKYKRCTRGFENRNKDIDRLSKAVRELQVKTQQQEDWRVSSNQVPTYKSKFAKEFAVLGILGIGGGGCVFKVENALDKWEYAVKRIAVDPSNVENALGEARTMARLDHPNIIVYKCTWREDPTEEWQKEADDAMLTKIESDEMHSNDDEHLRAMQSKRRQQLVCSPELRQRYFIGTLGQIVSGVKEIHCNNLIHRDLKPGNILVFSDELVKICDLGIATVAVSEEEGAIWRTNIGTDLYKAPEQSFFYDQRVDIFSIGLILLEISVVLTNIERIEVFTSIRCGIQIAILQDQQNTLDLVVKLTNINRDKRPSMDDILEHSFFAL